MELNLQSLFGLHVLFFDFTLSPIIDLKDAGSRRVKCWSILTRYVCGQPQLCCIYFYFILDTGFVRCLNIFYITWSWHFKNMERSYYLLSCHWKNWLVTCQRHPCQVFCNDRYGMWFERLCEESVRPDRIEAKHGRQKIITVLGKSYFTKV
jgi:hypothetical protein